MRKPTPSSGKFGSFLGGMTTKSLVFLAGALFVVDLVVMDPIPFVDEILLAGLTILLARWSSRRDRPPEPAPSPKPPPKNVSR